MKIFSGTSKRFLKEIALIENRWDHTDANVEAVVGEILKNVRIKGDRELVRLTKKFEGVDLAEVGFCVEKEEILAAKSGVSSKLRKELRFAADRISAFHKNQVERSWKVKEDGATLGQIIRPVDSAGIYAPGGKGAYPSSVLMNAIPAKVAGVKNIVLCTPATGGEISSAILVAADIAGVSKIYRIGGAQAIAAMAYGTKQVAKVDKITGPGNAYVAEAKRQVFGRVGVDMVAGPSEILIIADESAKPAFIAADLISQAEHDEMAYPVLVTVSETLAANVVKELKLQTEKLSRKEIIRASLKKNCRCFVVECMETAIDLANRFTPEHLEVMTRKPQSVASRINNAGAVFVGEYTPEAVGDYVAGPNHVLPTGGSARFFSPLGVYDFMKKTSFISFTKKGLERVSGPVIGIAEAEGFSGHAEAVRARIE
ncbi:MAG: histidinol dehydrogenase [Nitrospinota bacterium]